MKKSLSLFLYFFLYGLMLPLLIFILSWLVIVLMTHHLQTPSSASPVLSSRSQDNYHVCDYRHFFRAYMVIVIVPHLNTQKGSLSLFPCFFLLIFFLSCRLIIFFLLVALQKLHSMAPSIVPILLHVTGSSNQFSSNLLFSSSIVFSV